MGATQSMIFVIICTLLGFISGCTAHKMGVNSVHYILKEQTNDKR